MSKSASYKVRSKEQETYNVYNKAGAFVLMAHGEAHAKRVVESLNKDEEVKRAMRAKVI